jgi:flagellar protein FliO/FliZ
MTRRTTALLLAAVLPLLSGAALGADDRSDAVYGSHPSQTAPLPGAGGIGPATAVGILVLAGAGAWLYLKGRGLQVPGRARKLQIDETRSLGSRQYLVVASYEGRKLLLGVCPGKIDLLTTLDAADEGKRP